MHEKPFNKNQAVSIISLRSEVLIDTLIDFHPNILDTYLVLLRTKGYSDGIISYSIATTLGNQLLAR